MGQREKKEEEVEAVIPNWSELCPDLLRCVFRRLSFTNLNRAKSVCSSWHSASRGCVPKQNQIPWLILFPNKKKLNDKSSCELFVPEDENKVYKIRDLGVYFLQINCLATYGSWLLMAMDRLCDNLYILNPLTRERIDLPDHRSINDNFLEFCFWIDNRTKDYLVVLNSWLCTLFTKKGDNKWHELFWIGIIGWSDKSVYNHKNQKLYICGENGCLRIWDFSLDKPREDRFPGHSRFYLPNWINIIDVTKGLAVTVSGDVLMVECCIVRGYTTWCFHINKANLVNRKWENIASLGDEALILDMGITVVAKDTPGIKRNSIYFSGTSQRRYDPKDIFVYDLTTQQIEPLPQCVFSSIQFSDARWFFPEF